MSRSIVPITIYGENGNSLQTNAILDPGATRSVINRKIVDDLNLLVKNKPMHVITIDSIKNGDRDVMNFMISDWKGAHSFPVTEALTGDNLALENDIPPTKRVIEGFSHLPWSWTGGEYRRGSPREPVAYYTCYGWTTMGCNGSSTSDVISHLRIDANFLNVREDVNRAVGHDFEDVAVNRKCPFVRDLHAMKQLRETARFDGKMGHWVVGLPHKTSREDSAKILGSVDSSTPSRNRLIKSRERLRRDPESKEEIVKQMNALIDRGHVEKVDPNMVLRDDNPRRVMLTLFERLGYNQSEAHTFPFRPEVYSSSIRCENLICILQFIVFRCLFWITALWNFQKIFLGLQNVLVMSYRRGSKVRVVYPRYSVRSQFVRTPDLAYSVSSTFH